MDTCTKSIEIAWVSRLSSNGRDIRLEQLIDGQPENRPRYPALHVWWRRKLGIAKTVVALDFATVRFPFPMVIPLGLHDLTNINGVLVSSFGFRPSQHAIMRAKKRFENRLAA